MKLKLYEKVLTVISIILLLWIVASFIDINAHNMTDHVYKSWNVFTYMTGNKAEAANKLYNMKEVKEQGLTVPTKLYTEGNLYLLASLMEAENGSASDECLYLTGVVVLKRVKAKGYPNTIKDVIYQRGQYSTASKLKNIEPSDRALELAEDLLINGVDDYPDKLVFQAMFPQGSSTYKKINGEYFCLAK